jgi:hypothetical protein
MLRLPADPPCTDEAPTDNALTAYDREHLVTYLRLLDADAEAADWKEVARIVLHINPSDDPFRACRSWQSHLDRAKWMAKHGYKQLQDDPASDDRGVVCR